MTSLYHWKYSYSKPYIWLHSFSLIKKYFFKFHWKEMIIYKTNLYKNNILKLFENIQFMESNNNNNNNNNNNKMIKSIRLDMTGWGKWFHWQSCKKFKFDHTIKWYMHNPASVLENGTHKLLWEFDIQTDHLISTWRPDLIIINKKRDLAKL